MSRWVIDVFIIAGAAALIYFGGSLIALNDHDQTPVIQGVDRTDQETAQLISERINDISPTPPTSESWVVEQIDFVKDQDLAYATYHDTHNLLKILINTKNLKTVATFELESVNPLKWQLVAGEDKGEGKELINYDLDAK